jgi:hypothetical protein
MAGYLSLITRFQYVGARFRGRVPFMGSSTPQKAAVNLAGFTHECIRLAGERSLDQRHQALAHKLLVEADSCGIPPDLLPMQVGNAANLDWRNRFELGLNDALTAVEQQWTQPSGPRAWFQSALIRFCNIAPELTLIASILVILWRVIVERNLDPTLFLILLPFLLTLLMLVLLQLIVQFVLPLRWPAIRGKFRRELVGRLRTHLTDAYLPIPGAAAEALKLERDRIGKIRAEVDEVGRFLERQQKASSVEGLYGS